MLNAVSVIIFFHVRTEFIKFLSVTIFFFLNNQELKPGNIPRQKVASNVV